MMEKKVYILKMMNGLKIKNKTILLAVFILTDTLLNKNVLCDLIKNKLEIKLINLLLFYGIDHYTQNKGLNSLGYISVLTKSEYNVSITKLLLRKILILIFSMTMTLHYF